MKTLNVKGKYLIVLAFLACAVTVSAQTQTGKVEIGKHNIIIHPVVKLSAADEKAVNDVLSRYDTSLYRIETLKNGQAKQTAGSAKFAGTIESQMASAKAQRRSGSGISTACPY